MKIFLILFGALVLVLSIMALAVQPPKPPKSVSNLVELETYLTKLTNSKVPPGLSVVVVRNDAVVYGNSFGMANGSAQTPTNLETTYHWWSMTKLPTAIAILQLQEKGMLNLDDLVEKHLPFFQVERKGEAVKEITIRQLLNHTSGVPDVVPAIIGWVHYEDEIYNQTDLVKKYLPDYNKLLFLPGSDYAYTNLGYMVLGAIIEAVSGQRYEQYITDHVLIPAGMNNTGFLYLEEMAKNEAYGSHPIAHIYTPMLPFLLDMKPLIKEQQGKLLWLNRAYLDVTPSSGLIGSTQDVGSFMRSLLTTEMLLSKESKRSMLPIGELPGERPLGWAEYQLGERPYIQHLGGGPGFATVLRIYPQDGLGIAILANGTSLEASALTDLFASLNW